MRERVWEREKEGEKATEMNSERRRAQEKASKQARTIHTHTRYVQIVIASIFGTYQRKNDILRNEKSTSNFAHAHAHAHTRRLYPLRISTGMGWPSG